MQMGEPTPVHERSSIGLRRACYKIEHVIGFQAPVNGRSYQVYPDRRWVNRLADGTPENPRRGPQPGLGECRGGVSGTRPPNQFLHELLLDQSWDGVANAR